MPETASPQAPALPFIALSLDRKDTASGIPPAWEMEPIAQTQIFAPSAGDLSDLLARIIPDILAPYGKVACDLDSACVAAIGSDASNKNPYAGSGINTALVVALDGEFKPQLRLDLHPLLNPNA